MNNKGFTLVELILYIAIISIFIGGAVLFAWNVIYGQVKSSIHQEVNQNLRLASKRIIYEIRNASDINSVTSSTLSLSSSDSARNPTVFDLFEGQLRIGYGTSGACPATAPCPLTSNRVSVTSLSFTDVSSNPDSKNIQFTITIESIADRPEWQMSETYSSTAELRSN